MLDEPSPKFQFQLKIPVSEASVKVTVSGTNPLSGVATIFATGGTGTGFTVIAAGAEVLLPALFEAVRVTFHVPVLKIFGGGLGNDEYVPSPKLQFHAVGPYKDMSVKFTVRGAIPE